MTDAALAAPVIIKARPVTTESFFLRAALIGLAIVFMAFFLLLPLATVFYEAFRAGVAAYFAGISDPGLP